MYVHIRRSLHIGIAVTTTLHGRLRTHAHSDTISLTYISLGGAASKKKRIAHEYETVCI